MQRIIPQLCVLVAFCLFAGRGMAQQINARLVGLRTNSPRGDSAVYLGQQRADIVRILGAPTRLTDQPYGINNQIAKVLWYKKNRLFFVKDNLVEFDLLDDKLVIGETPKTSFGVKFKIANTPKQITKDAHRSSPNYINSCNVLAGFNWVAKPGISRGKRYISRYSTYLSTGGAKPSAWLEVLFNENGEVIDVAGGLL